ncbi:MAG: thiamine phosphate synthase [Candidatus Porifericomitaceae bacterium WSBS_2022_MAG_OTU9]
MNCTILQDARHSAGNDKDLHLPAAQLDMPTAFTGGNWRSASCHGLRQAAKAKQHGANILLVAPVRRTGSHPGRRALGWNKFNTIANRHGIPAYALGAMSCQDLHNSWQNGGRGIALHSHLWQDGNPAALIKKLRGNCNSARRRIPTC